MKKILVICGPTATGKTKLGLHLAKVLAPGPEGSGPVGEIISADSRQVYKRMDIGTGKDLPVGSIFEFRNSKLGGVYKVDGVPIWGYDLVEPTQEFSVFHFQKFADAILIDIWSRGKLPILVGGTGLYIKAIIDGITTINVPRNNSLRKLLSKKNIYELYKILFDKDYTKATKLNDSDRKNPRRLIRAIEVSSWELKNRSRAKKLLRKPKELLFCGLSAPKEILNERIEKRVNERIGLGVENEIKGLLKSGVKWNSQAMQSLGYRQWQKYFEELKGSAIKRRRPVIENWIKAEKQYAKRQMTWFKKDKRIHWFDIMKPNWEWDIEKLIGKWYKALR